MASSRSVNAVYPTVNREHVLRLPSWPGVASGGQRETLPLFPDAQGQPFRDGHFAQLVMTVLAAVIGATRAALYSTQ